MPEPLLGQLGTTSPPATAAERALAAALSTGARSGWLARQTAAWVWTGDSRLRPEAVDVAADGMARLTVRAVMPWATLPTRLVRATPGSRVLRLAGVAITDAVTTAVDCARLLDATLASTCLEALDRSGRCSLAQARAHLAGSASGRRRRAGFEALARATADRGHSRGTPVVTRYTS